MRQALFLLQSFLCFGTQNWNTVIRNHYESEIGIGNQPCNVVQSSTGCCALVLCYHILIQPLLLHIETLSLSISTHPPLLSKRSQTLWSWGHHFVGVDFLLLNVKNFWILPHSPTPPAMKNGHTGNFKESTKDGHYHSLSGHEIPKKLAGMFFVIQYFYAMYSMWSNLYSILNQLIYAWKYTIHADFFLFIFWPKVTDCIEYWEQDKLRNLVIVCTKMYWIDAERWQAF